MRGRTALCGAVAAMAAGAMVVPAAPLKPAAPAPVAPVITPNLHVEALQFAQNLNQLFAMIEVGYVRPVARADLASAAIRGLYDAVHEPMPADLPHEIRRADEYRLIALMSQIREGLGQHESLRGKKALIVAMQALPRALDPYSGVIPSLDQEVRSQEGNLTGVGLEFPITPPLPNVRGVVLDSQPMVFDEPMAARPNGPAGPIRVANVIPGSPAQRAGVRPGDLVVKIDGLSPDAPAFPTALKALQHVPIGVEPGLGRELRVTVARDGVAAPLEFRMTRTIYHPESVFGVSRRPDGTWSYLLDPAERLGYIRLGAIGTQDHVALEAALKSLQDQAVRGLVLDLRWCPGGFLRESATMARVFLSPELPIAMQRSRGEGQLPVDLLAVEVTATDIPIVVLVNGETSGGGELIAAALQDHGRAVIAGQRTIGKGSVQGSFVDRGYPFKITTGTFIRPSGKNFQRSPDSKPTDDWGVRPDPDYELPLTAELGKRLKEWHTLHALRPPTDRGALPIDDPETDPQRQAAVRMLRQLVGKK